jgi:hypothetical protein
MLTNIGHVFTYGGDLAGALHRFGTGGVPAALADVFIVGSLVLAVCFVLALFSLIAGVICGSQRGQGEPGATVEPWRLDDMLLFGIFGSAASFVGLSLDSRFQYIRYLVAAVVFAAILSGRIVAGAWSANTSPRAARAFATLGIAATLGYAACTGYLFSTKQPPPTDRALASWLVAHDLRNGIGTYWTASIVTVASSGEVTVRPVAVNARGQLVRVIAPTATSWYAGQRFQFFVYSGPAAASAAVSTFGPPAHIYVVGAYRVVVWAHEVTISPSR